MDKKLESIFPLKYLPIPIIQVSIDYPTGEGARQFTNLIPRFAMIQAEDIYSLVACYIRKLKITIEREYRKEIRYSNKSFDDYVLLLYSDITLTESPETDQLFIYCITELKLKKELDNYE